MKIIITLIAVLFISLFSINTYAQNDTLIYFNENIVDFTDFNTNKLNITFDIEELVTEYFIENNGLSAIEFIFNDTINNKFYLQSDDSIIAGDLNGENKILFSYDSNNSQYTIFSVNGSIYGANIPLDLYKLEYLGNYGDSITIKYYLHNFGFIEENTFTLYLVDPATASIDENKLTTITDVSVFPNPVINHLTIDFETTETNVPVELYSSNGTLLQSNNDKRSIGRNSVQMDVYDYPAGVYLVKVGNEVEKVIRF